MYIRICMYVCDFPFVVTFRAELFTKSERQQQHRRSNEIPGNKLSTIIQRNRKVNMKKKNSDNNTTNTILITKRNSYMN